MTVYLYGLHDPGGEHLMADASGTIVYTVDVYTDTPIDFTPLAERGFRAIVRLNHSHHGAGTIPPSQELWPDFARLCADYAAGCVAVRDFIVANEPNHEQEWGEAPPIQPATYAACYKQVYAAMKQARPQAQIAPAAIAPWTDAVGMGWIEYFQQMLRTIGPSHIDFLALHAYSRGYDPASVQSTAKMDPPYQRYYSGFRTYLDFLAAVPREFTALPVDITEANGDTAWPDHNTGWVQAAYAEINRYNQAGKSQQIRSLCLFRWQHFQGQPWGFEHFTGVHDDFRAAVAERFKAPRAAIAESDPEKIQIMRPTVQVGEPPADARPRRWDLRLDALGVEHKPQAPAPGVTAYRLVEARWFDVAEAQGRRHVFVDVLDEKGQRLAVPVRFWWGAGGPDESDTKGIDLNKRDPWADYGIDFPLSSAGRAYGVAVADNGKPSDAVLGLGLGTIEEREQPHHTAYRLVFQRATAPGQPLPPPDGVPRLMHPVINPQHRRITQPFGVNPERYARFGLDGHNGIDFGVPMGQPIRAAATGQAVEIRNDAAGYGKYIKLRHPWGETLYAHLSHHRVIVEGVHVKAGTILGLSGNTGNSTGPHLHFGLRITPYTRGRPFDGFSDPAPYLESTIEPESQPMPDIKATIRDAAREFQIDEELLLSLAWAESSFNPNAVSTAGAEGLLQIMPATWAEWAPKVGASDPFNARDSARVAAAYLTWCMAQGKGAYRGLVAYNWGIGHLLADKTPPTDTVIFAHKVIHGRDLLKAVME